ncbi:MAG TPA: lytic transglycosylase domain-containing protein [Candidatus Fimivivens faecavium]|nr:lytic transglycosylase domain-containing protein [Candidatus Fimivivens faecavium]
MLFLLCRTAKEMFDRASYPMRYEEAVNRSCEAYGVPRSLVYAVIRTESRFDPEAVSNVGARGLMQIMEETFDWAKFRKKDDVTQYDQMFDAETNIDYGTYILSLLLGEFENDSTAIAAYHGGWGNVSKWLADPQYSDDGVHLKSIPINNTDWYVAKVERAQKRYQALYGIE